MRFGVVVLLVATAGCDKVLGLHEVDMRPECGPPLADDLDEDGDGQLNKDDKCPLVANQVTNDEDMDDVLDDCDLCPQSSAPPGGDPDCDGLGAACDPDPDLINERRFYGFSQATEIRWNDVIDGYVMDGAAHLTLTDVNSTSEFTMLMSGAANGTYEMGGTIVDSMASPYWSLGIKVQDPADTTGAPLRAELQLTKGHAGDLRAVLEQDQTEIPNTRVLVFEQAPATLQFVMRATVSNNTMAGVVTVNGVTASIPPTPITPHDPILYGGIAIHDKILPATGITVDYFVYTTLP